MILLGIIFLILLALVALLNERIDKYKLSKIAELFINKNHLQLNEGVSQIESNGDNKKIEVFWFDYDTFELKPINFKGEILNATHLPFLSFPSFHNYINKKENSLKSFKKSDFIYLFVPFSADEELKLLVFKRKTFSIEDIMNRR
jgi:hypothetical protein